MNFRRRFARRVGYGGAAERLELRRIGDAAGDRDDGVAAGRMTGGTDTRRIDLAAEGFIVEHCVDDRAEIDGSQPPQRKTLNRVILQRVVAGMADRDGDEALRRECRTEPSEARRSAAGTMGQENER